MFKFIRNLSIVLIVAIALQMAFTSLGSKKRNQPKAIAEFEKTISQNPQIIYLGDSTNFVGKTHEKDKRRIDQFLQDLYPDKKIGPIFHAGYHTTIFKSYVEAIASMKIKPELVIVPINMRTVTNTMSQVPMFQFEEETFYLENIRFAFFINTFWKMIEGFEIFESSKLTPKEFDQLPILLGDKAISTVGELPEKYSDEGMRLRIINSYLSSVNDNLTRIKSIKEIISLSKENNIKVLFYITPIDIEIIRKYHSKEEIQHLVQNISFIENILQSSKTPYLNLSFDMPTSHFAWREDVYPNEHLDSFGRSYIATQITKKIEEI